MKLIVGLGNPGREYEATRHNCGFRVIEKLEELLQTRCQQSKFKSLYTKCKYMGEDIILLKPQTYMNNSGEAIAMAMQFYKLSPKDLLVIYDDLDTPVGRIRLRENGSAGGHNGMKSIINHVHTSDFERIRVGIGRVKEIPIIDYVLQRFDVSEQKTMDETFERAAKACLTVIEDGFTKAMNQYNQK